MTDDNRDGRQSRRTTIVTDDNRDGRQSRRKSLMPATRKSKIVACDRRRMRFGAECATVAGDAIACGRIHAVTWLALSQSRDRLHGRSVYKMEAEAPAMIAAGQKPEKSISE